MNINKIPFRVAKKKKNIKLWLGVNMGVNHNVLLGPYLECEYIPTEHTARTHYCSVNKNHPKPPPDGKYCTACGCPIASEEVKTGNYYSRVNTWEIAEAVKDRLYCARSTPCYSGEKNTHYWLPNAKWGGNTYGFAKYEEGVIPITAELLTTQLATFTKFFEKDITTLQQHYTLIVPRWGLLAYCS